MNHSNAPEFLIVAIGASAGGLEALEHFFQNMPSNAGMAFAVVQHLSPDHASALPHLLAKYTSMHVEQVQNDTKVAPDRVYIIPPNSTLTIQNGILELEPPGEPRGQRTPIDSFFSSLARDRGENAVCIMLSGTGSDGTRGLKVIKEYGGMALAQTLESAKYDSILRSAIATGLVDHILPVEQMPAKLMEYAAHLSSFNGRSNALRDQIGEQLGKVYRLLKRRAGHDFSQYKEGTITRRLERRMKALQIDTVVKYVELLERQPEETDHLFNDLLIGVTQFFRDPEAFETLAREVIPKLFDGRGADGQVRACVVGCASGEEAYSLAILLCEHAATVTNVPKIQIFATDIDERALETARKGWYPEAIAEHISPERLERFFIKQDNAYQIKRDIRERCIFSNHSFIKDPPFSRLDLVSCRNVMIYLGRELQEKMVPLFHYALRTGGYLFLGPSENITAHRELFRAIDKKHRIFSRKESLPRPLVQFPLADIGRPLRQGGKQAEENERTLPKQLERIILQRFRPACVTVKENGDAVYFSGPISSYLVQPTGTPETNIVNMAREGLRIPLRNALHRAATTRARVETSLSVPGETARHVVIVVEPLVEFRDANLYMVTFEESASGPSNAMNTADSSAEETIRHLEVELRSAQENSQATLEELETTNEELQSANEEFQSTNEELETSKEELQSFNEELETVNAELNRKVTELDSANSDLQNLLNSTQIATIFLDPELRIKTFTPEAGAVFRLIAGDVGRPITDLALQIKEDHLIEDIKEVIKTLEVRERQLIAPQDQYYQMRILPYRTINNAIDGVVITFLNVTALREAEQQALAAQLYAENIVETVRQPLLVLDASLHVKSANKSFYDTFQVFETDTLGKVFFELGERQWDSLALRRLLTEVLRGKKSVKDFQVEHDFPGLGKRVMLLTARQIDGQKQHMPLILLSIEDITESRDELLRLNGDLKHIAYATSHDLQEPLRMVVSYTQLLAREYKGKLDSQADQFIAYAVAGAQRMESLLKNLREYWSVSEHWNDIPDRVECAKAFDQAVNNLERAIQQSGARVTMETLPACAVEEVLLVLVLQNLIGNAIKYRRAGEPPRVHVSAHKQDGMWLFSVADNGIGIEAQHLDTIFAPFKRLHAADEYSGSGLGLAICKKIIQRAGGRIWAESSGQGAIFWFTLPDKEDDA
jgi:two-component system CheB/CheR fusion protein